MESDNRSTIHGDGGADLLAPVRGSGESRVLVRLYGHPRSETAAEFVDGADALVRRFVHTEPDETPPGEDEADDGRGGRDGGETEHREREIGLQIVPVAPELRSRTARASHAVRQCIRTIAGGSSVGTPAIAAGGYIAADRGGWDAQLAYHRWVHSREDPFDRDRRDLAETIVGIVDDAAPSARAANGRDRDGETNVDTVREALSSGQCRGRVRRATRAWLRDVPRLEAVDPKEAVVYVNGARVRSGTPEDISRAIVAAREVMSR